MKIPKSIKKEYIILEGGLFSGFFLIFWLNNTIFTETFIRTIFQLTSFIFSISLISITFIHNLYRDYFNKRKVELEKEPIDREEIERAENYADNYRNTLNIIFYIIMSLILTLIFSFCSSAFSNFILNGLTIAYNSVNASFTGDRSALPFNVGRLAVCSFVLAIINILIFIILILKGMFDDYNQYLLDLSLLKNRAV